jgi:hypothetical protein
VCIDGTVALVCSVALSGQAPKAAQRCAVGAGLDGERADRAIIRAIAMRTII